MRYDVIIDEKKYHLELDRVDERWRCRLDGLEVEIDAVLTGRDVLSLLSAGKSYEIKRERAPSGVHLWVGSARYAAELLNPRSLRSHRDDAGNEKGSKRLVTSMPGKVVRVLVCEGAEVEAGQGLIVVEAMKMQNEIKSPKKGIVQKLVVTEGANINAGDVLAVVE